MQNSSFIEGLRILQKYYENPDGYNLGAGHDIIYVYPTDSPVQETDLKRLFELGWIQPEVGTGDEGLPTPEQYDPEEGWGAYV